MTNLKDLKNKLNLRYTPTAFILEANAKSSIEHSVKNCWVIVLGCDMRFWVVCFSDAAKLIKAGYEVL